MSRYGVEELKIYDVGHGASVVLAAGSVVNFTGDAIVNAANTGCLGGAGVDGAISRAGGRVLAEAREALPEVNGERCPTGEARITVAGDLPVKWVIHAVGPMYHTVSDEEGDNLLYCAYQHSMRLAKEHNIKTVAFALLSSGIFRGSRPLDAVLGVACRALRDHAYEGLEGAYLVAFQPQEQKTLQLAAERCLSNTATQNAPQVGVQVRLTGLSKAELNDIVATVHAPANERERAELAEKGRVKVKTEDGKILSVKPGNLVPVSGGNIE